MWSRNRFVSDLTVGTYSFTPSTLIFGKVVLSVGAALRKSFFCPWLVVGLPWVCPHLSFRCSYNVIVMPWLFPWLVLKSENIPYAVFAMTFFRWKAFSKTFKGLPKGYLWSFSSPFAMCWFDRTSWVCHKSFIRPSIQTSRAQKGHCTVSTMSFIFLIFLQFWCWPTNFCGERLLLYM